MTFTRLTIVALLSLFIVWSSALAGDTLLQENFNGVALGDSVDEGNGQGAKGTAVWSKKGPKGWKFSRKLVLVGDHSWIPTTIN